MIKQTEYKIHNEFWKKYFKTDDYFDRRELIKTLPIFRDLHKVLDPKKCKSDDYVELLSYLLITSFQDFIDDAIEEMKEGD